MDLDSFDIEGFNKKLKVWYLENARPLLWRSTRDPYRIWLSEIILQQTRVAQGTPYYEKFILAYPTVTDLAMAKEQDVLRLWQGLGYYSRARNMHHTACIIAKDFDGKFPSTAKELVKLKGLGMYTASAVASFAFDESVPAIDGNVYRVMSRIFGVKTDILSGKGQKEFLQLAKVLVPTTDPGIYNQAMIEFGALHCVPVSPDCNRCVFGDSCWAKLHNEQENLPVKAKKAKVKIRYLNYIVFESDGKLGMKQRGAKDIWQGLHDFFVQESAHEMTDFNEMEISEGLKILEIREVEKLYSHILTHQRLYVKFWWVKIDTSYQSVLVSLHFYTGKEIEDLPKPVLINNFLKEEGYL